MAKDTNNSKQGVTARAFILGVGLSALFAWITVMRDNAPGNKEAYISANLIPVLPYLMLLITGLLINPLLRRIRIIRAFSMSEMLMIFVMCAVSSGLATFGLCGTLIPRISALSNTEWNTDQNQWDAYAMPFLHEDYFISAKGSQAAALKLHEADRVYTMARKQHRVANELLTARADLARVNQELARVAAISDPQIRAAETQALDWPQKQAQNLIELSEATWSSIGQDLDLHTVADTYAPKIERLKAERDRLRAELKALNQDAFDAVAMVRKGLPEGKRATPGLFYTRGEGRAGYKARFQRLKVGSDALKQLDKAIDGLASTIENTSPLSNTWGTALEEAANVLEPITSIAVLETLNDTLHADLDQTKAAIEEQKIQARELRKQRRYAEQNRFNVYEDKISALDTTIAEQEKDAKALQARLDKQVKPHLAACERVRDAQTALRDAAAAARSGAPEPTILLADLNRIRASFNDFDATPRRYWLGDVNWGIWVKPLFHWFVFALVVYLVFMSFNALIFRQWAHNEKFIYPIAEVTSLLAASGDTNAKSEDSLFRSGLFWTGVAIAAGVLGWNHLVAAGLIPNANPIKLQFGWFHHVGGGALRGLGSTYFCVIFAVIGLAFLVPSGITKSLVFFEVMYLVLLVIMSWLGYGSNRWGMGNPARNQLGGGAMIVFGLTILWTCRHYLLCAFKPAGVARLPRDERKELRVSSALFLAASLTLILMLVFRFGANPVYAVLFFVFAMVLAIALMRAVCEGGVLSIEGGLSLAGIITLVFGTQYSWTSPVMFIPFSIAGFIMFGGLKAFIASSMANAFKLREDIQVKRSVFHIAIWAGILVTLVTASVALIILSYDRGANALDGWMHTASAKHLAGAGLKSSTWGVGAAVDPTKRNWFFVGIILMSALLIGRRRIFGLPHPLGMVMLMNPVMYGFWGSILLGWMFKSLVSKYGSREQYVAIRRFFVGLVVGHLIAGVLGWEHMHWHWG